MKPSIAEYEVAPALGGDAGLAQFRRQLARAGLGLVLDFVPNHTATDHAWRGEDELLRAPTLAGRAVGPS